MSVCQTPKILFKKKLIKVLKAEVKKYYFLNLRKTFEKVCPCFPGPVWRAECLSEMKRGDSVFQLEEDGRHSTYVRIALPTFTSLVSKFH